MDTRNRELSNSLRSMQSLYLDVYIYALSSSMNPNILIFTDNLNKY